MIETWIQIYSGKKFFPLDPNENDLNIEDIAHALSNQCRFAGHVREFYSVAQHSVLVSLDCCPENALAGLLHDASEAYLVDLPRPLKQSGGFEFYNEAERNLMAAIERKFGLTGHCWQSIHESDMRVFAAECRDLMSPLHPEFDVGGFAPIDDRIEPLTPKEAKQLFLLRYNELTDGRKSYERINQTS